MSVELQDTSLRNIPTALSLLGYNLMSDPVSLRTPLAAPALKERSLGLQRASPRRDTLAMGTQRALVFR